MKIVIEPDAVVVQLTFWNRVAAARGSDLRVPLELIQGVRTRPDEAYIKWCKGLRVGTHIPGGFTAGTFYHWGSPPDFYYMSNADRTIALDLASPPSQFQKVILEVGPTEDPQRVAEEIEQAVEQFAASAAAGRGPLVAAAKPVASELQEPLL